MKRIAMLSGGVGSWAAAKRVAERHGTADLTLLFADTKTEDEDTYRFLREGAANVGGQLIEIADGRTIWEVFRDVRYLGNTRADPCSRVLKREMCDRWISTNCEPAETVIYVGIDWSEEHRFHRLRERRLPWVYEAPLCEAPYLTKAQLHDWATREGIRKQRLYVIGASHANCGGGCIKMGVGGFARLLASDPERFKEWEGNEQSLRDLLGDVAILRDRNGGQTRPLTLRALRERIEDGYQPDMFEIGGCGCFVDLPETLEGVA
jgi:hypothetical protein